MGGQEHDTGVMKVIAESRANVHDRHHGGEFVVEDVQVFGGYVLHIGHVSKGELRVGDTVGLEIDKLRRLRTASNHTATHLANLALRKVLGAGVDQKGSLVTEARMRFDFSHNQPVTPDELERVEGLVAQRIKQDLTVYTQLAPLGPAKGISGVRAMFGEVYPDPVRVVSIGQPIGDLLASPGSPAWNELSVEFCGGTHVGSTALIQSFAVISEEAVAKGVRRVTALTGEAALLAMTTGENLSHKAEGMRAMKDEALPGAVQQLLAELESAVCPSWRKARVRGVIAELQERIKSAGKAAAGATRDQAVAQARSLAQSAITANEIIIVGTVDAGDDRNALAAAVQTVRDACPRAGVMLFAIDAQGGKVQAVAAVSQDLITKGVKAGDWIREACAVMGGKGGGKPDNAQGGGTDISKASDAMKHARQWALKLAM
jgi:alanyl-tRNA synthetase